MTGTTSAVNTAISPVVVARPKLGFVHRALAIEGVLEASEKITDVGVNDDAIDVRGLMRLKSNRFNEERMIVTEKFVVVGALVPDTDCSSPLEDCDGEGAIFHRRNSKESAEFHKALGLNADGEIPENNEAVNAILALAVLTNLKANDEALNRLRAALSKDGRPLTHSVVDARLKDLLVKDGVVEVQATFELQEPDIDWSELFNVSYKDAFKSARELGKIGTLGTVPLDIYEHGGVHYSLSGHGMQCGWDTTHHGAVWVPDECAIDNIKCQLDLSPTRPIDMDDPVIISAVKAKAREYCKGVLENYNAWCAGDCHGTVVYVINRETGRRLRSEDEEHWGMIGVKYAVEELEGEMLNTVKYLTGKDLNGLSSAVNIH